jgi:predicted alpha/beta hydrolase
MTSPFEVYIPAAGQPLAGTFFPTHDGNNDKPVLICPATGITQKFYFPFAKWLASNGYAVLVFDYRGIGASLSESHVKYSKVRKQDWGLHDMPAALDFLLQLTGQGSAYLIGHSAGGQLFGLMSNHAKIRGVLAVAASSGYVKNIRSDKRNAAKLMLNWVIPISARLIGYIPAKRFGWGENLPKGVGLQWAKWCSGPGYVENDFDHEIQQHWYESVQSPLVFLHASDDEIATFANVEDIMRLFVKANKKRLELKPDEFGQAKLGHIDLFRSKCERVWPVMLNELAAM